VNLWMLIPTPRSGNRLAVFNHAVDYKRFCKILWLVFTITPPFPWNVVLADMATEDKVKTAYVYHIINFVTWPSNRLANTADPITICLIGDVEIQQSLFSLKNRQVKKHLIDIKRIFSTGRDTGCHILFIGEFSLPRVKEILQDTDNQAILTLGDFPGFVELGGMIGFTKRGNNIRLEINLDAANKAGITISAKLAEVAVNIIGGPERQ
jgi:hypothetical protein